MFYWKSNRKNIRFSYLKTKQDQTAKTSVFLEEENKLANKQVSIVKI